MTQKTIEQRIADTQDRLSRLKNQERRQRTHRLIVFGSQFAEVISDWQRLDDTNRIALRERIIGVIRSKANELERGNLSANSQNAPRTAQEAPQGDRGF